MSIQRLIYKLAVLSVPFFLSSLVSGCRAAGSAREIPPRDLIREQIREHISHRADKKLPRNSTKAIAIAETHAIIHQGIKRTYLLYTPSSYKGERAAPLVIGLHGGHSNPERFAKTTGFNGMAEKEGFIVAYPTGVDNNWNDGRNSATLPKQSDVDFISAMLKNILKTRQIDSRRIYATGISNGGFMTQRLACELSDQIAAFASVAATMSATLAPQCHPKFPIPILMINSPTDKFVPWEGGNMTRGEGGEILSVEDLVAFWRTHNHCSQPYNVKMQPTVENDGTTVSTAFCVGSENRSEVLFVKIDGGGHTWPGGFGQPKLLVGKTSQNLSATEFIWDFFKHHTTHK